MLGNQKVPVRGFIVASGIDGDGSRIFPEGVDLSGTEFLDLLGSRNNPAIIGVGRVVERTNRKRIDIGKVHRLVAACIEQIVTVVSDVGNFELRLVRKHLIDTQAVGGGERCLVITGGEAKSGGADATCGLGEVLLSDGKQRDAAVAGDAGGLESNGRIHCIGDIIPRIMVAVLPIPSAYYGLALAGHIPRESETRLIEEGA